MRISYCLPPTAFCLLLTRHSPRTHNGTYLADESFAMPGSSTNPAMEHEPEPAAQSIAPATPHAALHTPHSEPPPPISHPGSWIALIRGQVALLGIVVL